MAENLVLVKPSPDYESAFLDMAGDFHSHGEARFGDALDDFKTFVFTINEHAAGRALPEGFVQYQTYWMLKDDATLVAESRLRYTLTPALEKEGGHIGYSVRPSERRKGYGTRLLALLLHKAAEAALPRVLVTCNTENTGSAKIIKANGGLYQDETVSGHTGKPVSRYWINLY